MKAGLRETDFNFQNANRTKNQIFQAKIFLFKKRAIAFLRTANLKPGILFPGG